MLKLVQILSETRIPTPRPLLLKANFLRGSGVCVCVCLARIMSEMDMAFSFVSSTVWAEKREEKAKSSPQTCALTNTCDT